MEKIPELGDKNVRQAIAHAIDREGMIKKVERGYGEIMPMAYIYADHPYYNPNIKKYNYDVEKAKELMNGRKMTLNLNISDRPEGVKIAELVKNDLSKIGIEINIVSTDLKTHDSITKKGDYELALIYYGGLGRDPGSLKRFFYSYTGDRKGGIAIGYSNKKLDALLDAQGIEKDPAERKRLIAEAQEIIAEDVPVVFLYGDLDIVVYNPQKNNSWTHVYDHSRVYHPKLSFLK